MIQSDALSRRPDFIPEEDEDNDNMTMLPENLFINLIDMDLQRQIANCETRDKDATEALTILINKDRVILNNELNNWEVEKFEGKPILFFKGKNYVPQNEELRRNITKMFHDRETAGHPGEIETFNSIKEHYWWPGMRTFVKNYVKGCGTCQQFKIDRHPSKPAFLPTEGAKST